MMRSLSSGVAGLRTHQTKLDVIGNNVANVNTYGFKASRATFADVYYQNISGANRASSVSGGTNATQIGYGASVATIDIMNTVTGMTSTDRALDVYIGGEGFLVSKDATGNVLYSRLGNMRFDGEGNLVDGNGNFIQGFPMNDDGTPAISSDGTITGEQLTKIYCDPDILDRLTSISVSKTGSITGIMPGDTIYKATGTPPAYINKSISIGPNGQNLSGDIKMMVGALPATTDLPAALNVSKVEYGDVALGAVDGATITGYTIEYDDTQNRVTLTSQPDGTKYEGEIKDGKVVLYNSNTKKTAMTLTLSADPTGPINPAVAVNGMGVLKFEITATDKGENIIKLPETGPTQLNLTNGSIPDLGGMLDIKIDDQNGTITKLTPFYGSIGSAQADESVIVNIGNLVVSKFRNNSGLTEVGSSYFQESANSGNAIYVKPGIEGTGGLVGGALEMSNVDISKEFTEMITTQRGFQANSRIITVSDEMLQELVNLKR